MKQTLTALSLLCTALLSHQAAAAETYICESDGRAVFSPTKINKNCHISYMSGSNTEDRLETIFDISASDIAAHKKPDWMTQDDDIKILPTTRDTSVTNTALAASPRMNIRLRNQALPKTRISKPVSAPVIAPPPAKPQLTRKQILQSEIRNEQAALVRAQAQLNVARKKGNKATIIQLEQAIKDRQANIRAIQREMSR
ncbi:hypothetical protein [Neisseria weaveri]|uniref:hypothetical protein n=1 Tax=Neisseria weaveri TaxID=28091 RepID=UPI001F2EF0C5|nr:hypothetical protein [Neisseria weaveri]